MRVCKSVLPAIALAVLVTGCGGSGGGAAAPPEGKATVDGTLLLNDEPRVGEKITLIRVAGEKTLGKTKAKTDDEGRFVFESVQPGNYQLSVGLYIEGEPPQTAMSPLEIGGPCTESEFKVLVVYMENKKTGKKGFLAQPFVADSFKVEAGDRTTKDIAFKCKV